MGQGQSRGQEDQRRIPQRKGQRSAYILLLRSCLLIFAFQDLKLKYYDLMIQHALHGSAYLDVAKYYYKVWETPSIKEDTTEQGKAVRTVSKNALQMPHVEIQALEHIVYYIVLAPHSNEQSDMLHHLFADPALAKLELH